MSRFSNALHVAWERRASLRGNRATNCFRLLSGDREGIPGLTADIWDDTLVLYVFENRFGASEAELIEISEVLAEQSKAKRCYVKCHVENRNKPSTTLPIVSGLRWGNAVAAFPVLENGNVFEIRPEEPFSVGLFLDQRENRRFLSQRSKKRRVLNLFSYTAAFSVYAVKAGATDVVSIDLSGKYMDWGRKNFALNGLGDSGRWIKGDVFKELKRLERQKKTFDLIICDPPTFSRGEKGRVFKVAKDCSELIELCARVLAPNGELFFSSNFAEWDSRKFRTDIVAAIGNRLGAEIPLPKSPVDFQWEINPLNAIFTSLLQPELQSR